MTRRGDEAQAEALDVVECIAQRMDFELATVAGSGVDLADREAATELLPGDAPQPASKIRDHRQIRIGPRLGERQSDQAFEQELAHGRSL